MLIIPTYNESKNIGPLVERVRGAAGSIPIFFVDDNSPDDTAGEIRRLQAQDKNIYLIERPEKMGLGSAYLEAFRRIIEGDLAQFVIAFDADLSHPPEALPQIIELLQNYPVVVGSRYVDGGSTENWSGFRKFLSKGGNIYARILTGMPVSDLTAGFVGYRVEALKKIDLSQVRSDGYAFQIEMKYLLHKSRAEIREFPITFVERQFGKSKFSREIVLEGIFFPLKVLFMRFGSK